MTRIAAVQLAPSIAELDANCTKISEAIISSFAVGADIVVLPELSTCGYVFGSMSEARSVALSAASPIFDEWSGLAATRPGSLIVVGFAELGPPTTGGALYNSAAVLDSTGVLGVYRKAHLWNEEKNFFTPGDECPLVVNTPHGRLGVMICYDLEFPEFTRTASLAGADLLVVPTNWPLVDRPAGERAPEVIIGMAAARVNRMAIVCADRSGIERGVEWTEGTTIINADGWIVDSVGAGVGVVVADLDLTRSRIKRLTALSHIFDDRRPELYETISQPEPKSSRAGSE